MAVPDGSSPFDNARLEALRGGYTPASVTKDGLLRDEYLLASEGRYRVYYAPLGAYPAHEARIVVVGLTPGLSQMEEAARAFADAPESVRNDELAYAKLMRHRVAFAGTMRRNLCAMLDSLDFPAAFGILESNELFDEVRDDVAATSALTFPVFVAPNLTNFGGGGVQLDGVPLFRRMLDELLAPRLNRAPNALIVPLGIAAATGVRYLCGSGALSNGRVLRGMPHPSGGNGHRKRQFEEHRDSMRAQMISWFSR